MNRHAAGVILACLLAACNTKDGRVAAAPTIVEYALGDFYFSGPDTIPAGPVVFRFKLTGAEPHVLNFIRLEEGKRLADFMAAGGGAFDSTWVDIESGGVSITSGDSPLYTFSLAPGRYVVLCYFESADHIPHFAKGMVKEVVVAGPVTPAPPSDPVSQVDLVDYSYVISAPLPAGRHTIRVVNPSGQGHEVIFKRLRDDVSLEAGRAWIDSAEMAKGRSPWDTWGGVNMEPGDTVFMTADFPAGTYRMSCYYMLPGDSLDHAQRGMDMFVTMKVQ